MTSQPIERYQVSSTHTIQISWRTHVKMDLPARFVNHTCDHANVGITPNQKGAYDFYALRLVNSGDEILWDYETSEYEISTPFVCSCGSPECRKTLRGFRAHGKIVEKSYGKQWIAPYLYTSKKPED